MNSRYSWSWSQQSLVEVEDRHAPSKSTVLLTNLPAFKKKDFTDDALEAKKRKSPMIVKKHKVRDPNSPKRLRDSDDKGIKRIRESYACLRHRAMHKRCPGDCPDRRIPKPLPVATERRQVQLKAKTLPKDFAIATLSEPQAMLLSSIPHQEKHPAADLLVAPVDTASLGFDWNDSFGWEGFIDWGEQANWNENCWEDLYSSSQWEDSKLKDSVGSQSDESFSGSSDDSNGGFVQEALNTSQWEMDASPQVSPNVMMCGDHIAADPFASDCKKDDLGDMLSRVLLTKDTLEGWLHDPSFNTKVQGFYVRVCIGENNGVPIHRIGRIIEGRDSAYESYRLTRAETTKGLLVQFSNSVQNIVSIASVLNTSPSENELEDWRAEMERNGTVLSGEEIQQKADLFQVLNTKYPNTSH